MFNGLDALMVPPSSWLGVYRVERLYGGPEEGGWYWDCWFHLFSVPCWDDEDEQRARIERHVDDPDHDLASVLSEGALRLLVESEPAEHATKEKPHYE